jgi:GDP-4-dehydro-6-deoxy-D-mannose reductase
MRALITGVSGFAAQHLSECCAAHGAEVIGLGRRELNNPSTILTGYVVADLVDRNATRLAIEETAPDLVFHLAAEASVADSWKDPAAAVISHISSTLNVLESLRNVPDARVLIACSGEQYGVPEWLPVDERHALRPRNPYAAGKATADVAAGFYADTYGMHVIRARAFNHAGPGQGAQHAVSSFARQVALAELRNEAGQEVELLTGNLAVRRDFTDVRDVVRAYWIALECAEPGAYNVCSGRSVALGELLGGLLERTWLDFKPREDPTLLREHEVMEILGSHEKLTAATGWQPQISLERTLNDSLEWWRQRCSAGVTT